MRSEQIELFLELAKELHFWRTAEKMYITQSALSRQIQALEQELGFELFVRDRRSVKLTPAGEFMRDEWTRLIEEIRNIHRKAKQISVGELGTIRIGHPGSITYSLLPDLLAKVSAKYPLLRFELIETSALDLDQALLNYTIDLGFNRDRPENESLESEHVGQDHFGLFVPEGHPLANQGLTGNDDLRQERFILPSLRNGSRYAQAVSEILAAHDITPDVYVESEYGATILSLIARGLGVSIMPVSYSRNLPGGVRFVELPHRADLFAVWRKHDESAVLRNILSLLNNLDAS